MKSKAQSYFYLYGISGALEKAQAISAPGVDGATAVKSVAVGELTAWYSQVSAAEFGSELAKNLEDLDWLAQTSVRHQKAVSEIAAQMAIVPARLATVFVQLKNLVRDVSERAGDTQEILKKITDAEEWGVKVLRRRLPTPPVAVKAASGVDYLRQKAALKANRETKVSVSSEVVDFANALSKHAVAAAAVGKLSSAQRDLEWQAAFLIKKKEKAKWDAVLRQYATKWAETRQIECTGPWAPYSFV